MRYYITLSCGMRLKKSFSTFGLALKYARTRVLQTVGDWDQIIIGKGSRY